MEALYVLLVSLTVILWYVQVRFTYHPQLNPQLLTCLHNALKAENRPCL